MRFSHVKTKTFLLADLITTTYGKFSCRRSFIKYRDTLEFFSVEHKCPECEGKLDVPVATALLKKKQLTRELKLLVLYLSL